MRYVNHHKKTSFAWCKNAKPERNIKNKTCERFTKKKVQKIAAVIIEITENVIKKLTN